VLHQRFAQSFSEIGLIVMVLERPDHSKYFARVRFHELLGIVAKDQANHLTSSLRATLAMRHRLCHALLVRLSQAAVLFQSRTPVDIAATRLHFAHITL
jgi:hypothetical protein